jgi:hypothetical protein
MRKAGLGCSSRWDIGSAALVRITTPGSRNKERPDMSPKSRRPCDVCDGDGIEEDAGGHPIDCHLCEGAGFFDEDGYPVDDEDE